MRLPGRRAVGAARRPQPGTVNPAHLHANLAALRDGPLPPDLYAEAKRRLAAAGLAPQAMSGAAPISFKILLLASDADPSWPEKIRRAVPGVVVNAYGDPQDALDDIA